MAQLNPERSDRLRGFAPVVGEDPMILILGTMPSEASLQAAQYYGHPRNAFWPIQFALAKEPFSEDYSTRCDLIRRRRLALWDVLSGCRREGSLDAAIREPVANDIGGFLRQYPTIRAIVFNGKSAAALFRRLVASRLNFDGPCLVLDSTSAAYTKAIAQKQETWAVINTLLEEAEARTTADK